MGLVKTHQSKITINTIKNNINDERTISRQNTENQQLAKRNLNNFGSELNNPEWSLANTSRVTISRIRCLKNSSGKIASDFQSPTKQS